MLQLYLHKLIKTHLQGDLRYTYNNYVNEQTILVSIKGTCNSDAKRYAAYKTLKCTVSYLCRISNISSYDPSNEKIKSSIFFRG